MNIIIHGCNGRMGRVLSETASKDLDIQILCGIDQIIDEKLPKLAYPVFSSLAGCEYKTDVVIDFSHPTAIKPLLGWCILHETPVVIATTGLSPEEHRIIQEASKSIPVFQSANMSLGVSVLCKLLQQMTPVLGDQFDIEIVEMHHKAKKDAPSGTAFMLENAIGHSCPTHSVRAGSIPGEHTVIYAGPDEVLKMTHTAYSRAIFARGALSAAKFLINQEPGFYSMKNLT